MNVLHEACLARKYAHYFKHASRDLSIGHRNDKLARTKNTCEQGCINQLKQVKDSISDLLR